MNIIRKVRGKQKRALKKSITIRLDADLVEVLRDSGKGWQTRVNDSLRKVYLANSDDVAPANDEGAMPSASTSSSEAEVKPRVPFSELVL